MRLPRSDRSVRTASAGFTMVEVAVASFLVLVALAGLSSAVVSSLRLGSSNDELARAESAARQMVERLEDAPFAQIFASFNEDADDDPGGAGTVSGAAFAVAGLDPRANDADGMCGRILFPTDAGGALREDVFRPSLGMPRDLNGDGAEDDQDHSDDYLVLPVSVLVEWTGISGASRLQLDILLGDL
jgi:hypothetical protein